MLTTNRARIATAAGVAAALVAVAQTASADSGQPSHTDYLSQPYQCSVAQTAGKYGFIDAGTVLANNPFGLPAGPWTASGLVTLGDNGRWGTSHMTVTTNGTVVPTAVNGSWNVTPDCFITLTTVNQNPAQTIAGAVVSGQQEIDLIGTNEGVAVAVVGKRITPHS